MNETPPLPAVPTDAAPDAAAPPAAERLGLLARLTDRLNPILVREVHQALGGRAFVSTAALALLAIVIIALLVASQDEVTAYDGLAAFVGALQVLAPILLFIVPFQAFLSMRTEVGGGTVEHLLMSRLSPGAIVRGKLLAATVQFVIYLAIFSPLIGLTFLLRGVDVPTIAAMLTLAFILALGSAAVGIACGALCRWPSFFRVLPFAIMLLGLGFLAITATGGMEGLVRAARFAVARDEFLFWFASIALPAVAGIVLCGMIGSAVLAHRYENSSTKFRLYAIAFLLVGVGWILLRHAHVLGSSGSGSLAGSLFSLGSSIGVFSGGSAVALGLFAYFAATEPARLSPRVRTRVPRRVLLALLSAPFLPGGGRGMLFSLLLGGLAVGAVIWTPVAFGGAPANPAVLLEVWALWLYVLLYSGIAGFLRSRLAGTDKRTWLARATLPVLLLLSVLVPLLVRVGVGPSLRAAWTPLHLLNPFSTLTTLGLTGSLTQQGDILALLAAASGVVILLNVPSMVASVREVLDASRDRRQREG